jgi:hypothetical protein
MVLVGLTVAIITAGVPPMKKDEDRGTTINTCYAETDVIELMRMSNCSRDHAVHILNLACDYSIKPSP